MLPPRLDWVLRNHGIYSVPSRQPPAATRPEIPLPTPTHLSEIPLRAPPLLSSDHCRMGRLFVTELEGSVYTCKHCKTHIASSDEVISKSFTCRHGKAYLFNKVVNVSIGEPEERLMVVTGPHVSDVNCVGCGSLLGWKYVSAFAESQKFKEKKFLLARHMLLGPDGSQYLITDDVGSDGEEE